MSFQLQFIVVLSLAVAASAIPLVPVAKVAYAEPDEPAHYEFQYSVHDDHTGDIKEQKESRQGYAVQGSYSLVQPDGVLRVVDYTADKESGFNAVVRYEGQPKPAPTKILAAPVAKVAYAPAPVAYSHAPLTYTAPVTKVAYAAPVAKIAYAAPVAKLAYAAPVAKVTYAAPVAKLAYAAPVAKVAYPAPLTSVTFSSPAVSYHH